MFNPLQALVDLVLPPRCPACRVIVNGDGRFCPTCWPQLQFITAPCCVRCGLPFAHDYGPGAECGACIAQPPRFAAARAALVYGGPARAAVLALKHGDKPWLAGIMASHMARAGAGLIVPETLLVPVPLHRWRLWRRGYNQAGLLAQALAARTGAELAVDAIDRVKATPASVGMGRAARAAVPGTARRGPPTEPGGAVDRRHDGGNRRSRRRRARRGGQTPGRTPGCRGG